ncbi:unnamed protein product [Trifolium pratense]|uniref:Uncharacterized protein n=1 Tax=Trifolium pratense TaxID=57577 RepID=A0ACB0LSX9_TRIPR|nr:unnamed protein product [Trifolium pratense]
MAQQFMQVSVLQFPIDKTDINLALNPKLNEDPGPIDNYVLYDQVNHVSLAVWDGQCWSYSRLNIGQPKFNQDPDSNCFPLCLNGKGKVLVGRNVM